MVRYGVIFLFVLVCACRADGAHALSDAEYKRFTRESPAFAQAEKHLNRVWKKMKNALSRADYQRELAEQRSWIRSGRDAEALAGKNSSSPAAAYALVTERRALALESRLAEKYGTAKGGQASAPAVFKAAPSPQAAPSPGAGGGAGGGSSPAASASAPSPFPSAASASPSRSAGTPLSGSSADTPAQRTAPVLTPVPGTPGAVASVDGGTDFPPPSLPSAASASPSRSAGTALSGSSADTPAQRTEPATPGAVASVAGGVVSGVSPDATSADGAVEGLYVKEGGRISVKKEPAGYFVSISGGDAGGRWTCGADGNAEVQGAILLVTDREVSATTVIRIEYAGDRLFIREPYTEFCGMNGGLDGEYIRAQ